MNARIVKFLREEDGVTALEYGILAAVVAGLLITVFHDGLSNVFDTIMTALTTAVGKATPADG
jgi:pilus assembly protein Flp/PilA